MMAAATALLILIVTLSSCSPKIQHYKVIQVNGKKFKVQGHRGTFIAKDSIHIGQWVPVKL